MKNYSNNADNNATGITLKVRRAKPEQQPLPLNVKAHWQTRDKWRRQISRGVAVGLLEGCEARLISYLLEHGYGHLGWSQQTVTDWDRTVAWYAMWSERSVRRARTGLVEKGYLEKTWDAPFFLVVTDKLLSDAVDECWAHDVRRVLGPDRAEGMSQDFIDQVRAEYESHETVEEIVERTYSKQLGERR